MQHTRVTSRVLGALVIGATALSISACSTPATTEPTSAGPVQQAAVADADTAALVRARADLPDLAGAKGKEKGKDKGTHNAARALRHALHATWVTSGRSGTVTHQAIRGEVTAVSGSSITVKAKDGFSLAFTASADTTVRARDLSAGKGRGTGTDSTLAAVRVGSKALVIGVGAKAPTARRVVFVSVPKAASAPKPAASGSAAS